jgi:hypothetical protein
MKRDKISLIFHVFSLFLILSSCVQAQDRKSVTVLNSKTIETELHTWTLLSVEPEISLKVQNILTLKMLLIDGRDM